jgi:hypothetical protein
MKPFERRSFLKAIGCAAGALPGTSALCSPSVGRHHKRRVSQGELETAIELHAYWMTNDPRGKRAAFSNCDLSGRDFMTDRTEIINLHGADFTEADLIFVTGNEVNFRHASLQRSRLCWSHFKLPCFWDANLRGAECNNVVWGWPSAFSFQLPPKIDEWPNTV